MKKLFFSIFIFFLLQGNFALSNEKIAFFIPPSNWKLANLKSKTPYIEISFVKKETSICRPTLNLAIQKTSLTLEKYALETKKIHLKDCQTICRLIDKIKLPQGFAYIYQINKNTNSINFEIIQMIFINEGYAYILTGACKKEQLLKNYKIFFDVFYSFKIIEDLFSLITDKKMKDELIKKFCMFSDSLITSNEKQKKKNLILFEKYLDKKFKNLGKYFQVLLIKKAYKIKGLLR